MWNYLLNLVVEQKPCIIIDSVYGAHFDPDLVQIKKRTQKVEALKRKMGEKYLLHTPVEKRHGQTA